MASAPTRQADEQPASDQQLRADRHPQADDQIRAVYEAFDLNPGHVAMLSDPENEYAWIQSDVTVDVEA